MTPKRSKKPKTNQLKFSELNALKQNAEKARKKAYAPYSGFKVGAAILMSDKKVFTGCNVENASYGGTVCAERTAILKAISEGASTPIQAIHVVSSSPEPWPPCGLCLQTMAEFCHASTVVTISGKGKSNSNNKAQEKMFHFSDLLPESFAPQYLLKP